MPRLRKRTRNRPNGCRRARGAVRVRLRERWAAQGPGRLCACLGASLGVCRWPALGRVWTERPGRAWALSGIDESQ